MIMQFFTSFNDPVTLEPIAHRWRIFWHYTHFPGGWFWIDIVSVFPFNYLLQLSGDNTQDTARVFRYARFPRLLKMLRLMRIRRLLGRYVEVMPEMRALLRHYDMIKLFVTIVLLGHLMACSWYYFSDESKACLDDPLCVSWRKSFFGHSNDGGVHGNETSWGVHPDDHGPRYFTSIYWAFTTITTVGYGDISAQNEAEMAVSILSMVIGVHVFTSVASTLNAELTSKASAKMDADKKINVITSFLSLRRVPASLSTRIRDFYTRKYTHEVAEFDVAGLLDELPSVLSTQLEDYLYSKYWKIHSMSFWSILLFDHLDAQEARFFCHAVRTDRAATNEHRLSVLGFVSLPP
eukprot:SAG22_NODE_243_length_14055_cov_3.073015_8_plen_350_part_00